MAATKTRKAKKAQAPKAKPAKAAVAQDLRAPALEVIEAINRGIVEGKGFQGVIDLVGDRLRKLFKGADVGINWYDREANLVHFPYAYEKGKRVRGLRPLPPPKKSQLTKRMLA